MDNSALYCIKTRVYDNDQSSLVRGVEHLPPTIDLFSAYFRLYRTEKYELKSALKTSLDILYDRERTATILYTELTGSEIGYAAVGLESNTVKEIGGSLDNIEKICKKAGKPMDYFDIIDVAQDWKGWFQQVSKN